MAYSARWVPSRVQLCVCRNACYTYHACDVGYSRTHWLWSRALSGHLQCRVVLQKAGVDAPHVGVHCSTRPLNFFLLFPNAPFR